MPHTGHCLSPIQIGVGKHYILDRAVELSDGEGADPPPVCFPLATIHYAEKDSDIAQSEDLPPTGRP